VAVVGLLGANAAPDEFGSCASCSDGEHDCCEKPQKTTAPDYLSGYAEVAKCCCADPGGLDDPAIARAEYERDWA
jgi:hypothetical protein